MNYLANHKKTRKWRVIIALLVILGLGVSIVRIFLIKPTPVYADSLFSLNEGYGTTTNDINGAVSAGTITGAVWKTDDLCRRDKCLYFDGSGDRVLFSDDADLDFVAADDFTITGWFRHPTIATNPDYLVAKHESGIAGGYKIYMDSDGDIVFGVDDDGTWDTTDIIGDDQSKNYDDNNWHFFAAQKDGTTGIYLYVDGNLIDQDTSLAETGTLANAASFYIGIDADGSSNAWEGFLDEVKVYRSLRTTAELKADQLGETPSRGFSTFFGPDTSYLSNGLVGYWKMDEAGDATRADSSGNGNTLTESTADTVAQAVGKFGYAGDFEKDDTEYLEVVDASQKGLDLGNTFTLSAWLKPESASAENNAGIITKAESGQWSYAWATYGSAGQNRLEFAIDDDGFAGGGVSAITADNFYTVGEWAHFSITYNGSIIRLFKNGVEQISGDFPYSTTITPFNSTSAFRLGNWPSQSQYFDGMIEEVRVYNRALSPADVAKLYSWAPGPLGYWKMDEASWTNNCSTDTVFDSSGNGNSGDACPNSTGPTGGAIGKFGNSGSFDGSNDYLYLASPTSLDNLPQGNLTVSSWIKLNSLSGDRYIVTKLINTAGGFDFRFDSSQGLTTVVDTDGTDANFRSGWNEFTTGTWYHIATVWNVSTMTAKHYVNGVEIAFDIATTGTGNIISDATNNMYIGSDRFGGSNFNGTMDNVQIYNYARTPAQIIEDMNAGHPAPGSPVGSATGYWKFDEGFSTTAYDSNKDTGGAEDLTLSTASWTNSAKFGKAWNGTGALWVFLADDNDLDFAVADDFTLSLWFKSDSATNPGATEWILNKSLSGGTQEAGYAVYANTSGQLCFGIDDDTTWTPDVESCTTADYYDATWHHIVAVRNVTSDTTKIYIDAVEKDSDTDTTTATLANGRILYLGDRQGADAGDELNGDIDEVKIYRSALTADQVKVEYNHGFGQSMGALSTDSTGVATNSDLDAYCPPGQGSSCTAPVGHWKFDENTGTTSTFDTSANGNTGTLTGSMTADDWVPGKIGSALDFDGSNDAVTVTDNATLDFTSDFSIEFWINPDTSSQSERLVTKMASANSDGYDIMLWNGELNPMVNSTFDWTISGAAPTAGQWTHVAWTKSGTTSIVYMNGLVKGTNTGTPATVNTNAAALAIGGAFTDWFINGKLDDVRVYNYARTPAQVAWDYSRGAPVGWWKLDENAGTSANDSMGNSTAGTLTNTPTWVAGKYNYGVSFAGSNQQILIADDPDFDFADDESMTLTTWFKHSAASAQEIILSKYAAAGYKIIMESDGDITCALDYDATWTPTDSITSTLATYDDSNWHHIACVKDGATSLSLYIDGILIGSDSTITATNTLTNADPLYLGIDADGLSNDFTGTLDDVRIYRYPLTSQQIKTVMNNGFATRIGP